MKDGEIEQVGTPDEIYNSPASVFVAEFVGEQNIFNCQKLLSGINCQPNNFTLTDISCQEFTSTENAFFVIHADKMRINRDNSGLFGIEGHVISSQYTGGLTRTVVDVDGVEAKVVAYGEKAVFEVREKVWVWWEKGDCRVVEK
jgi:ABC-type Fe3+/spermidine/putrescine transport system ATPase subunit